MVQVPLDGGDQLPHVSEAAPTNTLVGEFSEPTFDQVQPRTRRRDEVKTEPGMALEPSFYAGMFVGPIVVHDEMQVEFGRRFGVDLLEETDELLVPMARHAVADHLPVEQTQ